MSDAVFEEKYNPSNGSGKIFIFQNCRVQTRVFHCVGLKGVRVDGLSNIPSSESLPTHEQQVNLLRRRMKAIILDDKRKRLN